MPGLRILAVAAGLAGCAVHAPAPNPAAPATVPAPTAALSDLEALVQRQVEAYNRRDLEAFLDTYAEDAEAFFFPDRPLGSGKKAFREIYGDLFTKTPDLAAVIRKRIVQGNKVIDEEWVTAGGKSIKAVAIYQVESGRIRRVWFIE